jgi:hypothetical protein
MPAVFTGEWIDPAGTAWLSRKLTDQSYLTYTPKPRPEVDYSDCLVPWQRLQDRTVIVKDHTAPKIDGKVRGLWIESGHRILVRHVEDLREQAKLSLGSIAKGRNAALERQQATKGDHKGKWFIARRKVAEILGVEPATVHRYATDGIPWWPVKGGFRKPVIQQFRDANNGRADFWLEDDAEEAKRDFDALGQNPDSKKLTIAGSGLSRTTLYRKRKAATIGTVTKPGKDKNGRIAHRRLFDPIDIADYLRPRAESRVPSDKMPRSDVATLFGVSESTAGNWFPRAICEKGRLRCSSKDKKRPIQLRDGLLVSKERVKKKWAEKKPGVPWPLEDRSTGDRLTPAPINPTPAPAKRGRGRPKGTIDVAARKRDADFLKAYGEDRKLPPDRRKFTTAAAAGRAYGMDESYAQKLVRGMAGK